MNSILIKKNISKKKLGEETTYILTGNDITCATKITIQYRASHATMFEMSNGKRNQ